MLVSAGWRLGCEALLDRGLQGSGLPAWSLPTDPGSDESLLLTASCWTMWIGKNKSVTGGIWERRYLKKEREEEGEVSISPQLTCSYVVSGLRVLCLLLKTPCNCTFPFWFPVGNLVELEKGEDSL